MSPEKWKRFKRLVTSALDQERTRWPSYLATQCGDDVDLFLDASSMLAAGRSMGDFIEAPAWHALIRQREILAYMGISPVEVVALEGTSLVEAERSKYIAAAKRQVDSLFLPPVEPLWIGRFSVEDKLEISALRDGQAHAVVNGDAAAYVELCTADVQLLIPGHDTVSGREQLFITEENVFRTASFTSFTKFPDRIEKSGDIIVETGHQQITMKKKSGEGGIFATHQKYMHMFRATADGWRYAALMSNPSQ